MLLLNRHTFSNDALAACLRLHTAEVLLVHCPDPADGGCEFGKILDQCPPDLVRSGFFRELAKPWYHSQPENDVSIALIAKSLRATPQRRASVSRGQLTAPSTISVNSQPSTVSTVLHSASCELRTSPTSSQRRGSAPIVQRLESVVASLKHVNSRGALPAAEPASPRTPRTPRRSADGPNAPPSPPPAASPNKLPPPERQGEEGVELA